MINQGSNFQRRLEKLGQSFIDEEGWLLIVKYKQRFENDDTFGGIVNKPDKNKMASEYKRN